MSQSALDIFSPHCLFKRERPQITKTLHQVDCDEEFSVSFKSARRITKAVIVLVSRHQDTSAMIELTATLDEIERIVI